MTFDIFASRSDRPKFESFYRTQESINHNPGSFRSPSAQQTFLKQQSQEKTHVNGLPLYKFPLTADEHNDWKKFVSFETCKPHATYSNFVKQSLKNEINDIAKSLYSDREKDFKARQEGLTNWMPAATETYTKGFDETKRFFGKPFAKTYGVKYAPAPASGQSLHELQQEEEFIRRKEETQNRLLATDTFKTRDFLDPRQLNASRRSNSIKIRSPLENNNNIDGVDIMSLCSPSEYMRNKDKGINKLFYEKNTIGERGIKRFEQSDSQALMYPHSGTHHGRILKLAGSQKHAYNPTSGFPVRQRFNQDLDNSIAELKNEQAQIKKKLRLGPQSPTANGSQYTQYSTISKQKLANYFRDETQRIEEDTISRFSQISKGNRLTLRKLRISKNAQQTLDGQEELDRVGPSPYDVVEKNMSNQVSPRVDKTEEIVFNADAPLEGDESKEDTAPTDEDATQDEPNQEGEEAPSEVNTVAYQNILNQIDEERAERTKLSGQIQEMAETIQVQRETPVDITGFDKEISQGQRNLNTTGINYQTHPDAFFGKHLYNGV